MPDPRPNLASTLVPFTTGAPAPHYAPPPEPTLEDAQVDAMTAPTDAPVVEQPLTAPTGNYIPPPDYRPEPDEIAPRHWAGFVPRAPYTRETTPEEWQAQQAHVAARQAPAYVAPTDHYPTPWGRLQQAHEARQLLPPPVPMKPSPEGVAGQRAADAQAEIDRKQFGDLHSQLETAGVAALKQVPVIGPGILALASRAVGREGRQIDRKHTVPEEVSAPVVVRPPEKKP